MTLLWRCLLMAAFAVSWIASGQAQAASPKNEDLTDVIVAKLRIGLPCTDLQLLWGGKQFEEASKFFGISIIGTLELYEIGIMEGGAQYFELIPAAPKGYTIFIRAGAFYRFVDSRKGHLIPGREGNASHWVGWTMQMEGMLGYRYRTQWEFHEHSALELWETEDHWIDLNLALDATYWFYHRFGFSMKFLVSGGRSIAKASPDASTEEGRELVSAALADWGLTFGFLFGFSF